MRYLYTILLYFATPFLLIRLLWRSLKNPAYRYRWHERFGLIKSCQTDSIWLHAVSLGECIAATPLITELLKLEPKQHIVVTTTTPTGSAQIQKQFGDSVYHIYAPYDLPGVIKRFLRRLHPTKVILMETELWPNLLHYLHRAHIPVFIANARLSERSFLRYQQAKYFFKPFLQKIQLIAAQSAADSQRFQALGVKSNRVVVAGNIKFDLAIPQHIIEQAKQLHQHWQTRPTWIAASTHEGEENKILEAFGKVLPQFPNALLILVPRHPERFTSVATLCTQAGYKIARRSKGEMPRADQQIYLGDTTGELLILYAASDIAFVGGSLVPIGGHNLIEPASLSIPIISGPLLHNFIAIRDLLLQDDALIIINSIDELASQIIRLFTDHDSRDRYGARALSVSEQNRGAVSRHLNWIIQQPHT